MTFKELIDKVRPTPLDQILCAHSLTGKKEGCSVRYKNDQVNIVVTGNKWYDNKSSVGGSGSIDLASHLKNCTFREAVLWLSQYNFSPSFFSASKNPTSDDKEIFYPSIKEQYAARDDNYWMAARSYLVIERKLNSKTIDELFKQGDIYATKKGGIAFVHRNFDGEEVGCSIRSINHQSGFRQSLGDKKTGWFSVGNLKTAKTIIIVESAIDALSFDALSALENETAIVSVSGAYSPLSLLRHASDNNINIVAAYDNDVAGRNANERLRATWNDLTQLSKKFSIKIPSNKDWNEDLLHHFSITQSLSIKIQ